MSVTLYTLLKSGVPRPVEINFSDDTEPIRFKPYESKYVSENKLSTDAIATAQMKEFVSQQILRIVGIHLQPTAIMSLDEVIDEIVNARVSNTRGITFISVDDRFEALENDLLDVVTVSEVETDSVNIPDDELYEAIKQELLDARRHYHNRDYQYGSLDKRLCAMDERMDNIDYKNIDIDALIKRIEALERK